MSKIKDIIDEVKNKNYDALKQNVINNYKNLNNKIVRGTSIAMASFCLFGASLGNFNLSAKEPVTQTPFVNKEEVVSQEVVQIQNPADAPIIDETSVDKQFSDEEYENAITIWSFNIEMDNSPTIPNNEMYSWENRKAYVVSQIEEYKPDIVCFQESTTNMDNYLKEALSEDYEGNRFIRSETINPSAYTVAIYYKKDRFAEIDNGKFWLSDTPEKESKGYDTERQYRVCGWEYLRDKQTGNEFYVLNAHYTFQNEAQNKTSQQIVDTVSKFNAPVFLTGDFNSNQNSSCYKILTEQFKDSSVEAKAVVEGGTTYSGYNFSKYQTKDPLDRIFYKNGENCLVNVLTYEVMNDYTEKYIEEFGDNKFAENADRPYSPSDHFAIASTIYFSPNEENVVSETTSEIEVEKEKE